MQNYGVINLVPFLDQPVHISLSPILQVLLILHWSHSHIVRWVVKVH